MHCPLMTVQRGKGRGGWGGGRAGRFRAKWVEAGIPSGSARAKPTVYLWLASCRFVWQSPVAASYLTDKFYHCCRAQLTVHHAWGGKSPLVTVGGKVTVRTEFTATYRCRYRKVTVDVSGRRNQHREQLPISLREKYLYRVRYGKVSSGGETRTRVPQAATQC